MPRKKIIYTHEYPYHITARTNNKERFPLPQDEIWTIFSSSLNHAVKRFKFNVHSFVLMGNHYHLLASTNKKFPLSKVMCWLQSSVARKINIHSGRINHIFGQPYYACLISEPEYFYHALRYIYQNPVRAGISQDVQSYKWSTLVQQSIWTTSHCSYLNEYIPRDNKVFLKYLNDVYKVEEASAVQSAMNSTQFKFPARLKKKTRKRLLYLK